MFIIDNRKDLKDFIKEDIAREEKSYKTPKAGRIHVPSFTKGYIRGMQNCLMFIEEWERRHPES